MRKQCCLVLAAILPSCASNHGLTVTPEMAASKAAYIQCLKHAAATFDDGTSDASSVAIGLLSYCEDKFRLSVDLYTANDSLEAKVLDINALRSARLPLATSVVLEQRAAHKSQ